MISFYRSVLLLSFLMISQTLFGQHSSTSNTELIDQIITRTGIESQVTQAPKEMKRQFESNPLGLEPGQNELMINLFSKAFMDDSLLVEVYHTFDEQYQSTPAQAVHDWLSETQTEKVLQAEQEFYTLQGSRQRVVRMYELDQNPASETRVAVIDSLMNATSAAESAMESQLILFRSIISAFSTLSDQQNFSEVQIDGIVSNYRLQIQGQIEEEIANHMLIMYYELEHETLTDYISFFESEAGQWLNNTTSQSIHSAFRKAADRFLESVRNTK